MNEVAQGGHIERERLRSQPWETATCKRQVKAVASEED
jgi:hypothetical protein